MDFRRTLLTVAMILFSASCFAEQNLSSVLRNRKITGEIADVNYAISIKSLKLTNAYDDLRSEATFKYNGDWSLGIDKSIRGGDLQFRVSDEQGNFAVHFKIQKSF